MERRSSGSVRVFYPKFNTKQVVALIGQGLELLQKQLSLKLVVLFGSYAPGKYTVASDIDLLVVYEGETRDDAYGLVVKGLGIPRLEPHVYSQAEYLQQQKTLDRMITDGIVIYREG